MEETQLIEALRHPKTRQAAFRVLVDQYQSRIYAHLMRMVGQSEDAADLTQEVMLKIWKHLDSFQGRSKLYTWIYLIATNEGLAFLEIKKKKSTISLDSELYAGAVQIAASQDMDGEDDQKRLQYALDQLPPKQRQVFLLRYYDEMPYSDMSEVLGTSEGALKASYHHAVHKIQASLGLTRKSSDLRQTKSGPD